MVFGRQRRYIETFIDAVTDNVEAVGGGDHTAVLSRMAEAGLVAHEDLLFLMDLSIEPVAAVIRGETG